MPATIETLGLDRLPREERIALVEALWDSIVADAPGPLLTKPQRQELGRRADEDDASTEDLSPWGEIKAGSQTRGYCP